MVTRVLWFRECHKLILHVLLLVDTNHLTRLTVWIVIDRTTSIVIQQSECLWKTYRITELSERQIRLVAGDCALTLNTSIREDGVDNLRRKAKIVLTERLFFVFDELLPVGITALKSITIGCLRLYVAHNRDRAVGISVGSIARTLVLKIIQSVRIPSFVSPVIIVDPCTEGVQLWSTTVWDDGLTIVLKVINRTLREVESGCEGLTREHYLIVFHGRHVHFTSRCDSWTSCCNLHRQLLLGLNIARLRPRHILFKTIDNV